MQAARRQREARIQRKESRMKKMTFAAVALLAAACLAAPPRGPIHHGRAPMPRPPAHFAPRPMPHPVPHAVPRPPLLPCYYRCHHYSMPTVSINAGPAFISPAIPPPLGPYMQQVWIDGHYEMRLVNGALV